MKKFYGILLCLALMAFKTNLQAQTCAGVTAQAISMGPTPSPTPGLSTLTNDYVVRATLTQAYSQDVTVTGFFYDASGPANVDHPYTVIVAAGSLSAQTAQLYTADNSAGGVVTIESVTPCPTSGSGDYHYYNINNVEQLTNTTLKDKVIQTFLSGTNNINPGVQYDTDNLRVITFEGSVIKGVYTEETNFAPNTSHNHVFIAYAQNNLVSNIAAEALINIGSYGNTIADIIDYNGQTVVSVITEADGTIRLSPNPSWTNPYAMLNETETHPKNSGPNIYLTYNSSRGFWDSFGECLHTGACQLNGGCGGGTAGAVAGRLVGMSGPIGHAGALLGCGLRSIFF